MTFLIEPAPLGSGVTFTSKVRTSDIHNKYVNEVKRAIPWSLKQGIHGYEVTDLSITLIEGSDHNVHSNPGDFLLATPMGVLRGLKNAGTDLLEPMYAFEIKANQELLGPISGDLNQMNAQIDAPAFEENFFIMKGRVSVAAALAAISMAWTQRVVGADTRCGGPEPRPRALGPQAHYLHGPGAWAPGPVIWTVPDPGAKNMIF